MRLDKFLANENYGSRKAVGALIRRGAVTVNGQAVKAADHPIDPERDEIRVLGANAVYHEHVYLMLHKPKGVLSASRDARQRTVLDLVPPEMRRRGLFPAGRLDRDTTGLLLLTDDGDFAHRMLAPKSRVPKRYRATLDRPAEETDAARFAAGITEGGETFAPAKLEIDRDDPFTATVTLTEGKYHEVKRLFHACGKEVVALERRSIGALELDGTLCPGEVKRLTKDEALRAFNSIA